MALLAQQELLEAAPARRLVVPHGHTAWWGIDTSVRGIAVGWVDAVGARGAVTIPLRDLTGGERLAEAYETVRAYVASGIENGWPLPGLVLVEQPSGKFDKPQLSYMVGVVQAAVFAGCAGAGCRPRVETVTSSSWKKSACGSGAIRKPKRGEGEYPVLRWARLNGYAGSSWDESDALAMAEAGRRTVALEQR